MTILRRLDFKTSYLQKCFSADTMFWNQADDFSLRWQLILLFGHLKVETHRYVTCCRLLHDHVDAVAALHNCCKIIYSAPENWTFTSTRLCSAEYALIKSISCSLLSAKECISKVLSIKVSQGLIKLSG